MLPMGNTPYIRDGAGDDSAPEVSCHRSMGREHDPGDGSDIETGARRQYSRQFGQSIGWSATGRGKLLNKSEERTGGDRLILTDPSLRSHGVDETHDKMSQTETEARTCTN